MYIPSNKRQRSTHTSFSVKWKGEIQNHENFQQNSGEAQNCMKHLLAYYHSQHFSHMRCKNRCANKDYLSVTQGMVR